jgi:hypothetical protein
MSAVSSRALPAELPVMQPTKFDCDQLQTARLSSHNSADAAAIADTVIE